MGFVRLVKVLRCKCLLIVAQGCFLLCTLLTRDGIAVVLVCEQ